jgi:serine/threonine protein phosphatase 1
MALLMNFSKVILLGQNLMGNCTVFRPKNKPNDLLYPKRLTLYDEIYRPYPVTRIGETEPVQKLVSGDTGAAFKGPLSILDVDTKECWQSEPLVTLYFDEKEEIKI